MSASSASPSKSAADLRFFFDTCAASSWSSPSCMSALTCFSKVCLNGMLADAGMMRTGRCTFVLFWEMLGDLTIVGDLRVKYVLLRSAIANERE